jgi:hypothetical protein
LGSSLSRLEKTFDSRWRDGILVAWQKQYEATQVKRTRLAALQAEEMQAPLNEQASLEMATLVEEVGAGGAKALPLLRAAVARFPESKAAQFALARSLLSTGEEEGVPLMDGVIAADPAARLAGSALLRHYFSQRGDHANGKIWHDRYVDEAIRLQKGQKTRRTLLLSDRYEPHGLDAQSAANLTLQLKAVKGVRHAYLVRKVDARFPDPPLYVLGVQCTGFFELHSQSRATRILKEITQKVAFKGETNILSVDASLYKFARKMRRVKGAKLV